MPELPVAPPPPPPPAALPPAPPVSAPSDTSDAALTVEGAVGAITGATSGGSGGSSGAAPSGGSGGPTGAGGSSGSGAAGGSDGSESAGAAGTSAGGAGTTRARDRRLQASRTRITSHGARNRRETILRFSLARPSVVVFRIRSEAPSCLVGKFSVRGRAGVNEIRFTGRFHGEPLPPGTYTLSAVARRDGRLVPLGGVTVVIVAVDGRTTPRAAPSPCAAQPSRAGAAGDFFASAKLALADAARATAAPAGWKKNGKGGGVTTVAASVSSSSRRADAESRNEGGAAKDRDELVGVVPYPFAKASAPVQTFLFAALGAAVLLVLVAALPAAGIPPRAAASAIGRRRRDVALAGALGLAAGATVVFLLS
ncbi:MAG: hypothetical protein M3327_08555 [Actinomycetota bacterium]|nr:hypothetical protein [Actinomycetota bacterium]